jgi:hypothetical protein
MPPDPLRIAALSHAYPRMRSAIISVAPAPCLILLLRAYYQDDVARGFAWLVAALFAFPAAIHFVGKALDRRFGRLVRSTEVTLRHVMAPLLFGAAFNVVKSLDDWSLRTGNPSVLIFVLAAVGVWLVAKDWPVRRHLLLFVAVCCVGAIVVPAAAGTAALPEWRANAAGAAVLAWMMVGVLDYLTLRRVLAPSAKPEFSRDA